MPELIRFTDLPSALKPPSPVDVWVEFFNLVLNTPQILNECRQVRKTPLNQEEWKIRIKMPKTLSKIDMAVFKEKMRKAGWGNLTTNLQADGNTELYLVTNRRIETVANVEVPANFVAAEAE